MTPSLFACASWLLPLLVLATLSTGELEFYQDAIPETSEDIGLKQLAGYLDAAHSQHQRTFHRAHLPPLLPPKIHKKHHVDYDRRKEKELLQALAEKSADLLQDFNVWRQQMRMQNDPMAKMTSRREYDFPYYDTFNPIFRNFDQHPNVKFPYPIDQMESDHTEEFKGMDQNYRRDTDSLNFSPYREMQILKGMKEMPISEFQENREHRQNSLDPQPPAPTAEFTFKFDDPDLSDPHPFGVKPNDPRYYQDVPFASDNGESTYAHLELPKHTENWGNRHEFNNKQNAIGHKLDTHNVIHDNFIDITTDSLPEPERRTGYHPLVVPMERNINSDIYFIAIVAGCSAAAMFALVLISLTWCRLQRGAKAASDIEYPAYGVTGPNKDVSPSGDQRLAQSAQMYHFQHQKQQIIAMENRASATRDPGSISEAESDEENEEGDYTVYECPGLASTGEMEVKNPLFHDDPTPATPAQTNKEEDHI